MTTPTELADLLKDHKVNLGLLDFLEIAKERDFDFFPGSPEGNELMRVDTFVAAYRRKHETIGIYIFLHPVGYKSDFKKIKSDFGLRGGKFSMAKEDVLYSLGMNPEMCHPFIPFGVLKEGKIRGIYIHEYWATLPSTYQFFPVYDSNGRIGTIEYSMNTYWMQMRMLFDKIMGIRLLDMVPEKYQRDIFARAAREQFCLRRGYAF